MTWLTLRQFRTQGVVVLAAVAVLAVAMAVTGPGLADTARAAAEGTLGRISTDAVARILYLAGIFVSLGLPAVIGMFWGAPLVARELETGTYRLAWTQGVGRGRWLAVKLGTTALVTAVAAGGLALAVNWWSSTIDRVVAQGGSSGVFALPRMDAVLFGTRGTAPVGYALFALLLGVVAGMLLRRTVPALAITLALVVGAQIALPALVREHLAPVSHATVSISEGRLTGVSAEEGPTGEPIPVSLEMASEALSPADWELANRTVDSAGAVQQRLPAWMATCIPGPGEEGVKRAPAPAPGEGPAGLRACLDRMTAEGYRQVITYQPASNFWALQWRETALLLAAAALLAGLAFRLVRRDPA